MVLNEELEFTRREKRKSQQYKNVANLMTKQSSFKHMIDIKISISTTIIMIKDIGPKTTRRKNKRFIQGKEE
jgi:Holliday junction resolvase RusA-like endonuclease